MALRGTIVRSNNGSLPYLARYADGNTAGHFVSVMEAQREVEKSTNSKLRWVREDRNAVEAYRGEDPI